MSDVLAHIRVRETAGIRRFLYPLSAITDLRGIVQPVDSQSIGDVYNIYALKTSDGQNISRQIMLINYTVSGARVDFALSLAPYETKDLMIVRDTPLVQISDPLKVTTTLDGGLKNTQERFAITIIPEGNVGEVVYDGIRHLRGPSSILRNEQVAWHSSTTALNQDPNYFLSSHLCAKSRYQDGSFAQTKTALTACKSWATMTHQLEQPKPNDEVVFTLLLAVTSPTLTCDFGVGGYVFGKLDEKAPEIVWRTEFGDAPHARWSVATAGRTDYVGEVETAEAFLPQRWFHLIDSDKALAVAITRVPPECREMTVRLTHEGDVTVAFRLGDTITGPAEFGVCYHFLNDVPAIAAATNPQSILLPPIVEVLPV